MSKKQKSAAVQPILDAPVSARTSSGISGARKSLRRFFLFLLALVLICGIYVLVTNGLYYWYSQPIMAIHDSARADLDAGLPATAASEADRLAFYQDCADRLGGLPPQIDALNQQPWSFAVLIREDLAQSVPTLLDKAERGRTAVKAYFAATATIQSEMKTLQELSGEPDGTGLIERLAWYMARIAAIDRIEGLFADLSDIPDIDLAGQQYTRSDLGLDVAADEVSSYREPVVSLQTLVDQSAALENQLNELYMLDPSSEGRGDARIRLTGMLAEQNQMTLEASSLQETLPEPLKPVLGEWQSGFTARSDFIKALQAWWQDSILISQSIESAQTDRATAKRYIEDSLAEENVETAYLWTRTAQQYQTSMATAIDFANIYIDRANEQTGILAASRLSYRTAFGMDAEVREIAAIEPIDPEAFWLAN